MEYLREMQSHGIKPDARLYTTLFDIAGINGKIDNLREFIEMMRDQGKEFEIMLVCVCACECACECARACECACARVGACEYARLCARLNVVCMGAGTLLCACPCIMCVYTCVHVRYGMYIGAMLLIHSWFFLGFFSFKTRHCYVQCDYTCVRVATSASGSG